MSKEAQGCALKRQFCERTLNSYDIILVLDGRKPCIGLTTCEESWYTVERQL